MLKKMRWRFIGFAMGAFSAVIILLAVVINLVNYCMVTNRQNQVIEGIFRSEKDKGRMSEEEDGTPSFPVFDYPGRNQPEFQHTTRFFTVLYNTAGTFEEAATDFVSSVSDEDARQISEQVLDRDSSAGTYQNFRYHVYDTEQGTLLIFLDISPEKEFTGTLMLISAVLASVSLLIVFGLIMLLSKRAIAPYVRNMERQKQFITDAGHELKTPLTSISASADVLKAEYGENEWISNIHRQTGRLSKLVANMIALSKLEEREGIPEMEDFSLSEAVWETLEPFASLAEAGHKVFCHYIEEDLQIKGDRSAIQQMLSVLLDNAIRYSDENGMISLVVCQERDRKILKVENTFEMDGDMELDRLFDRFYRPDGSRSKKTGGFGIGLSIAKAIAQAHNGDIEVCIPGDKRIRFTVILK